MQSDLYVANKSDLAGAPGTTTGAVPVSATTGAGLDDLRRRIVEALDVDPLRDRPAITNVRHIALVERAHEALARARAAALAEGGVAVGRIRAGRLAEARAALEEISGTPRAGGSARAHLREVLYREVMTIATKRRARETADEDFTRSLRSPRRA